ncbi:MAG: ImmA/IrrE family metallo-endopeptidase [Patescibacteria group bacterium]
MNTLVQEKSTQIIARYKTNNPFIIAEYEKIEVIEHPLSGRLKELYFGDYIILNNLLSHTKKRRYLAHALGHHFLHTGNQLFFAKNRYHQNIKEEAQAEEFAAYLLIPKQELTPILHLNIEELAEHFQVPPQFINKRLLLAKNNL